jgi:hypothetical protein
MGVLPLLPTRLRGWRALRRADAHDTMTEALRGGEDGPRELVDALIRQVDARIRWCQVVLRNERGRWAFPRLN